MTGHEVWMLVIGLGCFFAYAVIALVIACIGQAQRKDTGPS